MPRRGYKKLGYRLVRVYVKPSLYTALVLKSLNEGRTISDIINEALEAYLASRGPAPQATSAPVPIGSGTPEPQRPSQNEAMPFEDNPWVRVIRSKYQP
ncbi:hypothetical protein JCM16161A_02280 [Vulcanisaeta sp. JCM 16161]|uniref:hypothetical protein n=1 Tax=Vulcanisaeta sp. JCM 16161 TaxID=1295372 RepID=UPI0006D17C4E|nr:hypothetical protein [Vulcanisaeta sp. JCM 16161]